MIVEFYLNRGPLAKNDKLADLGPRLPLWWRVKTRREHGESSESRTLSNVVRTGAKAKVLVDVGKYKKPPHNLSVSPECTRNVRVRHFLGIKNGMRQYSTK